MAYQGAMRDEPSDECLVVLGPYVGRHWSLLSLCCRPCAALEAFTSLPLICASHTTLTWQAPHPECVPASTHACAHTNLQHNVEAKFAAHLKVLITTMPCRLNQARPVCDALSQGLAAPQRHLAVPTALPPPLNWGMVL